MPEISHGEQSVPEQIDFDFMNESEKDQKPETSDKPVPGSQEWFDLAIRNHNEDEENGDAHGGYKRVH